MIDAIKEKLNEILKFGTHDGIFLSSSELEQIYCRNKKDWTLKYDTNTGEFDSEKGAILDFECSLYYKNKYLGTGRGDNYYSGPVGVTFYSGIKFEMPEKKEPIDRKHIMDLYSNENNSDEEKVESLINYIKGYYSES